MSNEKTLSLPQKISVSFSGHLSTLFVRYSCCFTVIAQEDLEQKVKKGVQVEKSTEARPGCLASLSSQIAHIVGHTLKILLIEYSYLHFHWKITDQISLRMR